MALTDAELQAREGLITSSIAAATMGLDPYTGPLTAQMSIKRQLPPWEDNEATLRGDLCEPACLEFAARTMERKLGVTLTWEKPPFICHANGWTGASTDAVYRNPDGAVVAVGEAKTVSAREQHGWGQPGTDKVPDRVLIQCCWHLYHHPAAPECWVPVLMGGWDFAFQLYVVKRNAELITDLFRQSRRWYERHILGDEPALPDHRDAEALAHRWPFSDGGPLENMSAEMERWAVEKAKWRQIRTQAEEHEDTARARLIAMMKDHDFCTSDKISVSYRKTADKQKINHKALLDHLQPPAEVVLRFTTTVRGHRSLLVTEKDAK